VALAMQPTDVQITYFDWAGELANQFLGRLKNKLLGYGVRLAMGTPEICPDSAVPAQQLGDDVLWFKVETAVGEVVAGASSLPKDNQLGPAEDATATLAEGSCELF